MEKIRSGDFSIPQLRTMNKSRAWRAIEKVAELNELVYALNRFGEKTGLNKGEYRSPAGIMAQPYRGSNR